MKRHGRPQAVVTDGLRSYGAALKEIGNADRQEVGRWLDNRAENSHQPFRRRERGMERFRWRYRRAALGYPPQGLTDRAGLALALSEARARGYGLQVTGPGFC